MNDREVIQKLEEIRDAVDRLALVLLTATMHQKGVDKVVELVTPLLNEITLNRRFSSDKQVREHEAASAYKCDSNNPYKPKDYDKD